jgi:hypothetical protein
MAVNKKKELTETQLKLLCALPDDKYVFPGSLQNQSYAKLERMGFATSELLLAKRDNTKGQSEFRPAYKRTPAGKAKAESKQPVA